MRKLSMYLCVVTICMMNFGIVGMTEATLIGDDIILEMHYHNWGNVFDSTKKTVVEGSTDLWQYDNLLNVNVEANSIFIDFTFPGGATFAHSFPQDNFTGIVVRDINDDSSRPLQGFSIDTNLEDESSQGPYIDWNSRVLFGDNYIGFNWVGLHFSNITYFNATLDFGSNPVPEPSTVLLLATGIIGLASTRKHLRR